MSEWAETHLPCDECGSSDARSINTEGWSTCFACDHRFRVEGYEAGSETETTIDDKQRNSKTLAVATATALAGVPGNAKGIPDRGISPATTKKYGVCVQGSRHIYPYFLPDDGMAPSAAKKRLPNKVFPTEGPITEVELFGQRLFPKGGLNLVITEGETDAMACVSS